MNSVDDSLRRFRKLRQQLHDLHNTGPANSKVCQLAPCNRGKENARNVNPNILVFNKKSKFFAQPNCQCKSQQLTGSELSKQTKKKKKSNKLRLQQQDASNKLFAQQRVHSKTDQQTKKSFSPSHKNGKLITSSHNEKLRVGADSYQHSSTATQNEQIIEQLQSKLGTSTLMQILQADKGSFNPLLLPSRSASRKLKAPNLYQMQMQGKRNSKSVTKRQMHQNTF